MADVQIVNAESGVVCKDQGGLAGYVEQTNMNVAASWAQLQNLFQVAML
jgi:hypothetical protein